MSGMAAAEFLRQNFVGAAGVLSGCTGERERGGSEGWDPRGVRAAREPMKCVRECAGSCAAALGSRDARRGSG